MTNNKLFLFVGTGLSLVPIITFAQCVSPVQDCYALGYTQTSCPNGKGVKCPFGAGWYCGGIAAQDCIKLGYDKDCTGAGERGSGETCNGKYKFCSCDASYQYTCTGTGYAGGTGSACGGKYTQCSCSSGYEWKDGSCQKQILNGAQGDLYYCNGTVVGVKSGNMNFYVAKHDLGQMSWYSVISACQNYSFCGNLKGILPTLEQLKTIYYNKSSLNNLLSANGGTKLTSGWYWSSTYGKYSNPYLMEMSDGNSYLWSGDSYYSYYVLPVLEP